MSGKTFGKEFKISTLANYIIAYFNEIKKGHFDMTSDVNP